MRVLICGSRGVKINVADIDESLLTLRTLNVVDEVDLIISGGASGPDRVAIDWAKSHGCKSIVCPANWEKYGRSAGMIRNRDMVEMCDVCLGFWDGKSRGTEFTLESARKLDKKTFIVDCSNGIGDMWAYPKDGYKTRW